MIVITGLIPRRAETTPAFAFPLNKKEKARPPIIPKIVVNTAKLILLTFKFLLCGIIDNHKGINAM